MRRLTLLLTAVTALAPIVPRAIHWPVQSPQDREGRRRGRHGLHLSQTRSAGGCTSRAARRRRRRRRTRGRRCLPSKSG